MPRINLDLIEVESPCTVPWESMPGNDRVRHCGQCQQNVYQLSNLTRQEAEALILEKQGTLCARFYRRADGSVITRECAALRWWRGLTSVVTLTVMGLLTILGLSQATQSAPANSTFSFISLGAIKPPAGGGGSSSSPACAEPGQSGIGQAPPPRTPATGKANP